MGDHSDGKSPAVGEDEAGPRDEVVFDGEGKAFI